MIDEREYLLLKIIVEALPLEAEEESRKDIMSFGSVSVYREIIDYINFDFEGWKYRLHFTATSKRKAWATQDTKSRMADIYANPYVSPCVQRAWVFHEFVELRHSRKDISAKEAHPVAREYEARYVAEKRRELRRKKNISVKEQLPKYTQLAFWNS